MRGLVVHPILLLALPVLAGGACTGKTETLSWDGKDAWRQCAPVIDAWRPGAAAPLCSALHMCSDEAKLTDEERGKLGGMFAASGCQPP